MASPSGTISPPLPASASTSSEDALPHSKNFWSLGTCLANGSNVADAMANYPMYYTINHKLTLPHVHHIIKSLIDMGTPYNRSQGSTERRLTADISQCFLCRNIMVDPATIPCGHTYCKKCLTEKKGCSCVKCGYIFTRSELKINIIISQIIEKWWLSSVVSFKLTAKAKSLVGNGSVLEGIKKFEDAYTQDPSNQETSCCLAETLLGIAGKENDALFYAEIALRLNPLDGKGYFLKAHALRRIGLIDKSIVSFLCCALFEYSISTVMNELIKLFEMLLRNSLTQSEDGSIIDQVQWTEERNNFQAIVSQYAEELAKLNDCEPLNEPRPTGIVDKQDLDCPLCLRLLWHPVTAPCGHMFCKKCLERSLDHSINCPMCKASLDDYLAERRQSTTEFVELAMQKYLSVEFEERKKIHDEELEEIATVLKDPTKGLPIFVCTVAMPKILCPLHVFEPRYRLMTRQCMETGFRQFGMCGSLNDSSKCVATYGTLLNILDIKFFPDGRSVLQTVGVARFKVIHLSIRDGYHVANIEYILDTNVNSAEIPALEELHGRVYAVSQEWFSGVPDEIRKKLVDQYGPLPAVDPSYINNPSGPLWVWWLGAILPLDNKEKLSLLGMTSLARRLKTLLVCVSYLLEERNREKKEFANQQSGCDEMEVENNLGTVESHSQNSFLQSNVQPMTGEIGQIQSNSSRFQE